MTLKEKARRTKRSLQDRLRRLPEFVRLWNPPVLHDVGGHKAADWWELFFDLVCVASMGQAAHLLVAAIESEGAHDGNDNLLRSGHACDVDRGDVFGLSEVASAILQVALGLMALLQVWLQETLFWTRFDGADDILHRILKVLTFFGAAALGANITYCIELDVAFRRIGEFYAVARFTQTCRVFHAIWINRADACARVWIMTVGTGALEVVYMFGNILIPSASDKFVFIIVGIWVVATFRMHLAKRVSKRFQPNAHHFPERMGLLVILTLGECIIQQIHNGSKTEQIVYEAACGFIVFSIWWIYFDNIVGDIVAHWLTFDVWVLLHLPLISGIVCLAACTSLFLKFAEEEDGWHSATKDQRKATLWLFCAAMAVLSASVSIIRSLNARRKERDHKIYSKSVQFQRIIIGTVLAGVFLLFPIFRDEWTVLGLLQATCALQTFRILADISSNFRFQLRLASANEKRMLLNHGDGGEGDGATTSVGRGGEHDEDYSV